MTSCVLDTNIIWVVDGKIRPETLPKDGQYVVAHVQVDEVNRTKEQERRALLLLKLIEMTPIILPTETTILGASRLGCSKLGSGVVYLKIKEALDKVMFKPKNIQDALIAELAILNHFTLLTADRNLADEVKKLGGKCELIEKSNKKE